jgi:hypothetical protein
MMILNNNWFEVTLTKDDTELDVCFTYDEGIEMLNNYVKEGYYQNQGV